jgi:hypothetical protein
MENELIVYRIGVIVKMDTSTDRFVIYNKLRAIQDVIIVTPKDIERLNMRNTVSSEFGYVSIKFLSSTNPADSIKQIELAAIRGHETAKKIDGIIAMYYNPNKIEKI